MKLDIQKVKIFVTVPTKDLEKVRNAMCEAGAGVIGNYSYCSTSVKSTGTFLPNEQASPYNGSNNKMEFVEEEKLEVICDVDKVRQVLKRLREVHPYEEPEIDIVPLIDESLF